MGIKGWMLGLAAAGAAGEYGIARYFFHRTVVRGNAKRDRTQKMAGTDWDAYIPGIRASREWLAGQPQEDVYITSRDGSDSTAHSFAVKVPGGQWCAFTAIPAKDSTTIHPLRNFI